MTRENPYTCYNCYDRKTHQDIEECPHKTLTPGTLQVVGCVLVEITDDVIDLLDVMETEKDRPEDQRLEERVG